MHSSPRGGAWRGLLAILVLVASVTALAASPAAAVAGPAAHVQAFGGLAPGPDLLASNKPVVGITATPSGAGYWLVAGDGGVFPFGDAEGHGSTGNVSLYKPIVGMAATPSGHGYWMVAADGGIFPFGDAPGLGSVPGLGITLNKPAVGMAATVTGLGYWIVAADGGIFPFGDAPGLGSTGGINLARPMVAMAASATGLGYWMVAADGGIFPFGDAAGIGSVPGTGAVVSDVVGMGRSTTGAGYVLAAANGRIWSFGDAPAFGPATLGTNRIVAGVATAGAGAWLVDVEKPPPPPPPRPSVGPPLPAGSGAGRRIVFCGSCERTWLVEADGTVSRSYLVSGRYATPRPGTYAVYSKSRYASAGHDGITMEYMVRFAYGRTLAIGFHTIPRRADGTPLQTLSQLGTYQSSGCVRQNPVDAVVLWNFAPVGTKVVVTP
ncbi:MAG: L,D-transpeptidase [Acidimicrobiales bacterium]